NGGELRTILLSEIVPPTNNVRQEFDEKSLAELAESIRQQGVLQPILVREIQTSKAGKYKIVAGERRYRAAKLAGLEVIPAQIREMNDEEALSAQIVENLEREDVHPLDEAEGFLRLRQEMKLEIHDIAARVARDARHIARRLALTNLIDEAREDFRKGRITLAHALEICRLAPEIQKQALAACYETKPVFNKKRNGYDYVPDKGQPARPVSFLKEWLAKNVYLNLKQARFDPRDSRLREDGL